MSFIVTDPLHKEVIDIVEDRRLPTLIRYFHRYPFSIRKKVKAVVIEMILELDDDHAKNQEAYQNLLYSFRKRDYNRFCKYLDRYNNNLHDYLNTVITTFISYKDYIKNTFISSLRNGFIEGINNKIKLIKRVFFGYRSFVNLRTRVMVQFALTKKVAMSNITV